MTDINFYHLTSTSLDQALPKLLEKSLQAGFRVMVRVADEKEAERISGLLWTYNPDSFLPHGTLKDGHSEQQPVFITAGADNPNQSKLLAITDGSAAIPVAGFDRVLDIFNGADDAQVGKARSRWKAYAAEGHALSYIKQNDSGGWDKQNL